MSNDRDVIIGNRKAINWYERRSSLELKQTLWVVYDRDENPKFVDQFRKRFKKLETSGETWNLRFFPVQTLPKFLLPFVTESLNEYNFEIAFKHIKGIRTLQCPHRLGQRSVKCLMTRLLEDGSWSGKKDHQQFPYEFTRNDLQYVTWCLTCLKRDGMTPEMYQRIFGETATKYNLDTWSGDVLKRELEEFESNLSLVRRIFRTKKRDESVFIKLGL